jgi:hypothetical protein
MTMPLLCAEAFYKAAGYPFAYNSLLPIRVIKTPMEGEGIKSFWKRGNYFSAFRGI